MAELYIIKAGEFDPEKQERQVSWCGAIRWGTQPVSVHWEADYLIVVRDKPKPKTLEEVINRALHDFGCAKDLDHGDGIDHIQEWAPHAHVVAQALREAFPELADK